MDRKKWIRDLINELDREKEKLSKEHEKETARKEKDIQAKNAQADILHKFIKNVQERFEKAKEDIDGPDSPCNIDLIRDKKTGRLCAIQMTLSLVNHNKSFYLKYEGKAGDDNIRRETFFGDPNSLSPCTWTIGFLTREEIDKQIDDFLTAVRNRI